MARETPRIYASLDDHQVDHQATVVEVGVKIATQSISILIDPRFSHSYIHHKFVGAFSLKKIKYSNSWLVHLATWSKRKVSELLEICLIILLNELSTHANLNFLPLESYDVIIGMDWLGMHRTKLDFYNKVLEYIDDEGRF